MELCERDHALAAAYEHRGKEADDRHEQQHHRGLHRDEQVTTGDNRGVEFDQFPAELLNSVVVYKTPDAALVGQGLSGIIDMQTARPLSFGERVIALGDGQIGAAQQVLMHANRAVSLTAAAEQVTQRKVQLDRFRVEFDDFDKRVDRLIGLLIEQEIQATEVRTRQVGAFGQQRLEVVACGHPAERKSDGYDKQPPEV